MIPPPPHTGGHWSMYGGSSHHHIRMCTGDHLYMDYCSPVWGTSEVLASSLSWKRTVCDPGNLKAKRWEVGVSWYAEMGTCPIILSVAPQRFHFSPSESCFPSVETAAEATDTIPRYGLFLSPCLPAGAGGFVGGFHCLLLGRQLHPHDRATWQKSLQGKLHRSFFPQASLMCFPAGKANQTPDSLLGCIWVKAIYIYM